MSFRKITLRVLWKVGWEGGAVREQVIQCFCGYDVEPDQMPDFINVICTVAPNGIAGTGYCNISTIVYCMDLI